MLIGNLVPLTGDCLQICLQILKERFCENENYSVMPAIVSLILDTRRMKIKTGKYPVKLQVSFERTTLHYQTIFDLQKDDYSKLSAPRIGSSLLDIRDRLKSLSREAEDYIKDMSSFSFYEFERDFITAHELFRRRKKLKTPEPDQMNLPYAFDYSPYLRRFSIFKEDHSNPGTISIVYFSVIKRLLEEQRIGTALSYQDSYNSFKKFRGNVCFTDITISYLHQYEQWMKARGVSKTTIGIKIRPLRTMFNEAFEMGIIKRDKCYPFGRRKYRIPTGRNIKKAIGQDFIKQLYYEKPLSLSESKAKDFWLFCYFGNGMNPKDVVHLKFRDIQDGYIVFIRHKTERTTRNDPKPITVYITEDLQNIIDKWGNKNKSPNDYIFPVMDDSLSPMKQYSLVTAFTRFINDNMNKITLRLGIDKKITTIVSRHSFSTQLKRSGVSTEFIQEALGHTDKKTTEHYLDSFENSVKKEYASMLTSFKNSVV